MKKLALTLFLALTVVSLQAHALNGTWNLTATGTPHGDLHFQARFTQGAGKALAATVTIFDNPIEMKGETEGTTFRVSGEGAAGTLTLSGKLKTDGTLEGFLSNDQGDLLFTGKRAQ